MPTPITYRLTPDSLHSHLFAVTLTVAQPLAQGQGFYLPAWVPGSYLVRDFARHIVEMSAEARGQALGLYKRDKHSWQLTAGVDALVVRYWVYAYDLSVRGAYLDQTRGFFNGASVFLALEGFEDQACEVYIDSPRDQRTDHWQLATALTPVAGKINTQRFGLYRADNYDELIDHPVEMGLLQRVSFKAAEIPHELVVSGHFLGDLTRLARDMKKICTWQLEFFGPPAPFKHYVFLLYVGKDIYGGLEHRQSCALMINRSALALSQTKQLSDEYVQLLGLISHEYFHSWNVKRIKPAAFAPYDLTRENYTRLLWAFEGVTSYYDDLCQVRCGLIDAKRYLTGVAHILTALAQNPGSLRQTLEESSFDAWIKFYRPDENSPNSQVSYYSKGAMFALTLDLSIRRDSGERSSLDDVMRALWARSQKAGGIAEDEWERIACQTTGLSLAPLFDLALRSTEALPLGELLASQGIELCWEDAQHDHDQGGVASKKNTLPAARASLGVKWVADPLGLKLKHVYTGQAACEAGLSALDIIIAVDGLRFTEAAALESYLSANHPVTIHAFRRDELMSFVVTPQKPAAKICRLYIRDAKALKWIKS